MGISKRLFQKLIEDAHLVDPQAMNCTGDFAYTSSKDKQQMNGSILILGKIIKNVVWSVSVG